MSSTKPFFSTHTFPLVIAHRGFSEIAPENTLAAFHKAIEVHVDMIELDVRLSADNDFIIFHDKRLERTSNGHGVLKNKTTEELLQVDNGSWFSQQFSSERISLLEKVFPFTKKNVLLNIEIKPDVVSTDSISVAEKIVSLIHKKKIKKKIIITSFNYSMVKEIKELDNNIFTGIIYNPLSFRRSPSQLLELSKADIFVCSKYQVNKDVVNDIHSKNYSIYVYGISSERDVRRMFNLGVEGLIANNPAFVKEILQSL